MKDFHSYVSFFLDFLYKKIVTVIIFQYCSLRNKQEM